MTDTPITAATNIAVANNALARIGGGTLFSFDEDTELADAVNAVFVDTIEACLSAYPWSFGLATTALQLLAGTPLNGYAYAYALPANRIGLPSVILRSFKSREPLRDFKIEGAALYADQASLWATCRVRPSVDLWLSAFRLFATTALAAELAVPVSHDSQLGATLKVEAWGSPQDGSRGGLLAKAIAQDAAQPGPQPIWTSDPLTTAHRDGGNWWGHG